MTSFNFRPSLVITRSILDLTLPVAQLLQGSAIDIADAKRLIESLKSLICCKRNTLDTFHKKCYSDIVEHAYKVGIEECKPRTSKLQSCKETAVIFLQNQFPIISKSIEDSFTWSFDSWNRKKRFDHGSISVYSLRPVYSLVIIPLKMVSLVYKNINWREKFCLFADVW